MKKILISFVVALMALSASAQVYVGGALSWTHDDDRSYNSFELAPEVGYYFTPKWALGCELAYAHDKQQAVKSNSFIIAPYARYIFFNKGIVRLFVDGSLGFSTQKYKDVDDSDNGFEIGFKPGIAFEATKHICLEAHYGFLGYRDKFAGAGANASVSGLDFDPNSLRLSIKYEF